MVAIGYALNAGESFRRTPFKATSRDGVLIFGEIDLPAEKPARAVVLMVPGTGGFTRDVRFGNSGGPGDLIFKTLARRFTAAGFGVARFVDERGVGCADPVQAVANFSCRDDCVLGAVTAQTKVDDLGAVAAEAHKDPRIAGKCLILFAHSEGMLTAARAIEQGLVKPAAILGVGAPMESPQSVLVLADRPRSGISEDDGHPITTAR